MGERRGVYKVLVGRLSVRVEKTQLPLDGFSWIYFNIFRKFHEKIQFSFKSDKKSGHCSRLRVYICDRTSQNYS
jgi:hypothetical protein